MTEILLIIIDFFALAIAIINGAFNIVPMWIPLIIPGLIVLKYLLSWISSLSLTPSKKECPTCNNQDIKLTYALGQKKGLCEKCGTSFNFYAEPEIKATQRKRRNKVIGFTVFFIIILLVGNYYKSHTRPIRPQTHTESVISSK